MAGEELQESIVAGVEAIVVLDQTSMYAEMGGQVADHGTISSPNGVFEVTDVQKNKGGKYMHYGVVKSGELKVGDVCTVSIDRERREAVSRAHSATHLLHAALRKVLGDHVQQAGSLVEPDYLRFDFTHFAPMTPAEIAAVEHLVNVFILSGSAVTTEELPIEEAKARGAMALFSEKYGDVVRVVTMGDQGKDAVSVELCGGTHLNDTAKAGPFRITSEFSVASGVRRIEASTGFGTLAILNRNHETLLKIAETLKANPAELVQKAEQQIQEMRELRQTIEKLKAREFLSKADQFLLSAKDVSGLKVVAMSQKDLSADDMRKMGDFLRDKEPTVAALLASVTGEKITFLAVCGKEAVARGVKAGDIIKAIAPICGGKGGGKPDSAMGGGSDLLKLDDALAALDDFVAGKVQ